MAQDALAVNIVTIMLYIDEVRARFQLNVDSGQN